MKIFFITTILLSNNCNGGEVASQSFIDALKILGHQVTVIGYLRKGDLLKYPGQETLIVDERYTETRKSKFYAILWLLKAFLKNLPYSSTKYFSRDYVTLVKKMVADENYDIIIIDHVQLSWIESFIKSNNKLIGIFHNIEYQIYENSFKTTKNLILKFINKREASLIRLQEQHLLDVAEQVWTLTEHDAVYFSKICGLHKIKTFALPTNFTKLQNTVITKSFDIGILGSWTWKPNIEALQWFLEAIYPYLSTNLSIHIAGKGGDWLIGKYPNIQYRGVVPNAQEFMAQARVVAIPTLNGGGIQIKTLDAIASGSYIVATAIALRGIYHLPSTVQVATDAMEFANLLTSAVDLPYAEKTFDEAKNWYYVRQDKFIHDIASAINDL